MTIEAQSPRVDSDLNRALFISKQVTFSEGASIVYPEAVGLAVITSGPNLVTQLMAVLEADTDVIEGKMRDLLRRRCAMHNDSAVSLGQLTLSDEAKNLIKMAEQISRDMGDVGVGVQHILLAFITSKKIISDIFELEGVTVNLFKATALDLSKTVVRKRTKQRETVAKSTEKQKDTKAGRPKGKEGRSQSLTDYCRDLTLEASEGKLSPVIGRDEEIERIITVICRKNKNNPVLVGGAGVGKTAIVEGVAQRIACGAVPHPMKDRKIWQLDMSDFVAGTQFRGQFEEKMKFLKEQFREHPEYILFIDELHTVMGAGGAIGTLDAGNILKPSLAKGELRCIGATTEDEAKKYLSKDSALNRRFQKVDIKEPCKEETLRIVRGLKGIMESHHHCIFSEDAINAAVQFSDRYLTGNDKHFPDKAIDIIDEMGASSSVRNYNADVSRVLTRKDAAEVVAKQAHISVDIVLHGDIDKANLIDVNLREKVIGQDHAISSISSIMKASYSGVRDPDRPIAVLFFVGPSGTGKTYTSKLLNKELFDSTESLIWINMTEFSEKHTVSKLIGSPPGYVGFGEPNQLTDRVSRKPYSLILIDEFEKAHPDVLKLFYRIFREGELTDSESRTINFRNTIIIMTSNIGTDKYDKKKQLGFGSASKDVYEEEKDGIISVCQDRFGSHFSNRVDEFVLFNPLEGEDLVAIADLRLKEFAERLSDRDVKVTYSKSMSSDIVELSKTGHGVNANSIEWAMRRMVEPALAEALSSQGDSPCTIRLSCSKGKVICRIYQSRGKGNA